MKKGDVIDGYTVFSMLGEGGMAYVYEVEKDGEKYAMKVCKSLYDDDIPRFKREYRMLSSIHNQYVIKVFSEGKVNGLPYYIMERGQISLADIANGNLSDEEKFRLVMQVCQGVEAIHSAGIVHRDLKPNNVICCNGVLKVSDFGLGRFVHRDTISLTMTGTSMGSYGYAAPELDEGDGAFKEGSPLLDIYALGGIIYYVFSKGARPDMINSRNVEADILSVVNKCREQEPSERFQTVQEVRLALEAIEHSRNSFLSISDILNNKSLTDEEKAKYSLGIFVKSDTIREALDIFQTVRLRLWTVLKNTCPDYASIIANTALKVFSSDESTWVQFSDVDTIAEMVISLSNSSLENDKKVALFRIALKYAVKYNRWAAMRTLYGKVISQWNTETIKPYAEVLVSCKDMFIGLAEAIGVRLPGLVTNFWKK